MRLTPTLIRLIPVMLIFFQSCARHERPVTKEEATALAGQIEAAAVRRDDVFIDQLIDEQGFGRRVAEKRGKPLDRDIIRGSSESLHNSHFGGQVTQALGKTGSYLLVKQYEKDKRQHLLFRLYVSGSLNYHDYELVKPDDRVKAVDIYIYRLGESMSKTYSDLPPGMQNDMADLADKDIERIKTLFAQGEMQEAAEVYDKLPGEVKHLKAVKFVYLQIAQKLSDSIYFQALGEYKTLYPDDPSIHLMMIDARIKQKDFPMALESVDKLDSIIDKDPLLDLYRGIIYQLMNDSVQSRTCLERLHKNMPGFFDGTIQLIMSYAGAGEVDKAAAMIRQTSKESPIPDDMLKALYNLYPKLRAAMQAGN